MGRIVKSKERVKKHAEVYTPIHIVRQMIDCIEPDRLWIYDWKARRPVRLSGMATD